MKKCSICKEEKSTEEFNKNSGRKDGLQSHCKICSKEKFNRYYNDNREKHSKETRERSKIQRLVSLQFVYDYLKEHGCVDCPEKDPTCLEFDHVRGVKSKNISDMLRNNNCVDTIKEEIEKCDVRCANCHRKKTAKDQGWYKNIVTGP